MNDPDSDAATMSLLASAGFLPPLTFSPTAGGANNRVFVVLSQERRAVLKYYLEDRDSSHHRLVAEYGFLEHVFPDAGHAVAAPLRRNDVDGIGLYSFIEGRPVAPEDLCLNRLNETLSFVSTCNARRHLASHLKPAAEACFSLKEHMTTVERRLVRVEALRPESPIERDCQHFVESLLRPCWDRLSRFVKQASDNQGWDWDAHIPECERCLSPSDFGYHNAMITPRDTLAFFDFEYAGWDDPAKMVGDFFSQPRIPAPLEWYGAFSGEVAARIGGGASVLARMRLLMPVYRIKWCLIMLNEFLPSKARRRTLSGHTQDIETAKAHQLGLAEKSLSRLVLDEEEIRIVSDDAEILVRKGLE